MKLNIIHYYRKSRSQKAMASAAEKNEAAAAACCTMTLWYQIRKRKRPSFENVCTNLNTCGWWWRGGRWTIRAHEIPIHWINHLYLNRKTILCIRTKKKLSLLHLLNQPMQYEHRWFVMFQDSVDRMVHNHLHTSRHLHEQIVVARREKSPSEIEGNPMNSNHMVDEFWNENKIEKQSKAKQQ